MKIIDEATQQEITNPDLTIGELTPWNWVSAEAYAQAEAEGLPAVPDSAYENVLKYHVWTADEIAQREEAEREAAKQAEREKLLLTLSEAFSEELVPSDKQGFLWKVVRLGEVEIMREYVTDPDYDPTGEDGTYLKPFTFTPNMEVIETKWYTDGEDIWECIKSGVCQTWADPEFFDVIA